MSTFDGHIREFPDIQVDYFRTTEASAARPPLACFLSHVHSDHLVGLESLRSPFVYCSAATAALLLRLEKKHCRINFAKGILEGRIRTFAHLQHLLKPLPLDTPTTVELSLGNHIRVTLFDANHCPGSVMFLFEDEHKAALYTGDTRLEPWFVNSLTRSPCLAEYMAGLRTINTVYLDTTFIEPDVVFETKAEGMRQLLLAVSRYPPNTIFFVCAWTFGYEDVWAALAKSLRTKVHVDPYKLRLYKGLEAGKINPSSGCRSGRPATALDPIVPSLVGFLCGNTWHDGCLCASEQPRGHVLRIHSCEKGMGCPLMELDGTQPVVEVRPVVCRLPHGGGDLPEVGAGGEGKAFFNEGVPYVYDDDMAWWREVSSTRISKPLPKEKEDKAQGKCDSTVSINSSRREAFSLLEEDDGSALPMEPKKIESVAHATAARLPRTITFPYSRHSSYTEQCNFLDKLHPRDVWPCTVRPDRWLRSGRLVTIQDLFGRFCVGSTFRFDEEATSKYVDHFKDGREETEILESQASTERGQGSDDTSILDTMDAHQVPSVAHVCVDGSDHRIPGVGEDCSRLEMGIVHYPYFYHDADASSRLGPEEQDSQATLLSEFSRETRLAAHQAAVSNAFGTGEWVPIQLASTSDNHTMPDVDLGTS